MSEPKREDPCEMLPWDSAFFGFPVATMRGHGLTPERCSDADRWCAAHGVRCLYFNLGSFGAFPQAADAEAAGFHLVDVKLTLSHLDNAARRDIAPPPSRIRLAREADLPQLERIAARSHRNTRFFNDSRFPVAKAEELYRTWIRNSVRCGKEHVWVAGDEQGPCGYCACAIDPSGNIGSITLIAVDDRVRRQGFGVELVNASLHYFGSRRTPTVQVVTQAHNTASMHLYERCGFLTSGCSFAYHKWYDDHGR
jgi:ribosomal protein S18 acetylase RimI-like enzyme